MNIKVSRVRKVPQFPHSKGSGVTAFFQLIIGVFLWIVMLILFAIGAWAAWFGSSLSLLLGQTQNNVPWWFSWLCTIFLFPVTLLVVVIAELMKIIRHS